MPTSPKEGAQMSALPFPGSSKQRLSKEGLRENMEAKERSPAAQPNKTAWTALDLGGEKDGEAVFDQVKGKFLRGGVELFFPFL